MNSSMDAGIGFDDFPVYTKLVKTTGFMDDYWVVFMGTFYQNLISYLSQYGIFVPRLTSTQRDAIVSTIDPITGKILSPQEGQMIYNTTTLAPQIWQLDSTGKIGAWKTFTTT